MNTAFLSLPEPGDRSAASLDRKLSLLAARVALTHPLGGLSRPLAAALSALRPAISEALKRGGAAAVAAFSWPEVLTPLLCLLSGARPPEAMLRLALPELLAALSRAGALREALLWDLPVERLTTPRGAVTLTPAALGLAASSGGVELRLADRSFSPLPEAAPSLHPIGGHGVNLATHDANPLSMMEDHPDKQGNALSLGGRGLGAWTAALDEALSLIRAGLPSWYAELPHTLRRLVPVGFEPERHLSASYREAPGVAYLTLHPSALTLAEAVVHETQHGKLNRLSWLDAVLVNGRSAWTPSPVRPDLRPLMGVMLAAHAFVPVAALHRALAEQGHPLAQGPDFARRRREVLGSNARALAVLRALGEPTALGERVILGMEGLHQACCEAAGEAQLIEVTANSGPEIT